MRNIVFLIVIFLFTIFLPGETLNYGYPGLENIYIDGKPIKKIKPSVDDKIVKWIVSNNWMAVNMLLNCNNVTAEEKENIRAGSKKYSWNFTTFSPPSTCANKEGMVGIAIDVQKDYLFNLQNLDKCCKVPLWQTLLHELAHWYITGYPWDYEQRKLVECEAFYIEEVCVKSVGDCRWPSKKSCEQIKKFKDFVAYHPDNPDDNVSYSSGFFNEGSVFPFINQDATSAEFNWFASYPAISVLKNINSGLSEKLIDHFGMDYFTYSKPEMILSAHKILLIPTSELFGLENDSVFKASLQEYLRLGGTIIVFAQQYGSQIDNVVPVPEGESLHSYGWREDQSCSGNAGYFKQMHPGLASLTSQQARINVDGYFATYPSTATVLLRRVSNQQPCLISYPYGNGTVILTSMYSDWGAAHSQTSSSELRLVRDLVTYAKNPNLAIPMYNLTADSHPDIALNVTVKNESESAASKVKLIVYTPDRKTVLYETEASLALAPGSEGVVPLNFNLSATLTSSQYGLCHSDYELYDAEGNLLQMASEADSGRLFA